MAAEPKCSCKPHHTVAVVFLLFSAFSVLPCYVLRDLDGNEQQNQVDSEATEYAVRTGIVIFNDREFTSDSEFAAVGHDVTRSDDSGGSEETVKENPVQTSHLQEAAWRRLHTVLHCGETKMKLKAMGPGATDLQLDTGEENTLPLNQIPETCGYSLRQNALGLVLVVPYDGCMVLQEDGNYVLLLRWLDNTVKLVCPFLQSPEETPELVQPHLNLPYQELPSPIKAWAMNRQKRQVAGAAPVNVTDPNYLYWYYYYYYYYYYLYLAQNYPYYYNYQYYPVTVPPDTTTATPTTTPNTSPTTSVTTTPSISPNTTLAPTPTEPTTAATPVTTVTEKPTTDNTMPDVPDRGIIYYQPVIQNYYGQPPYPTMPTTTEQTTEDSSTDKPDPTSTPSTSAVTPEPTTKSTRCTKGMTTTTTTTTTTTSDGSYQTPGPYVEYQDNPFGPVVSYIQRSNDGPHPDFGSFVPEDIYKSGLYPRAYPDFSGVAAPWYLYHTGYENIPT